MSSAQDGIRRQRLSPETHRKRPSAELQKRAIHDAGAISEKDNEAVLFALVDGKTLRFGFKEMYSHSWRDYKGKRLGRVLPPFITRLLQRYASYSQRPGLPRIPHALMPLRGDLPAVDEQAAAECECEMEPAAKPPAE